MQKGFSLAEMLVVSLFGSFLLLAASQVLTTLIRHQVNQSELLRLTENSALAEIALKNGIRNAFKVSAADIATSSYPKQTEQKIKLDQNYLGNEVDFDQFRSSDWLLLFNDNKSIYSLFHLDKKSYGHGLAYKYYEKNSGRSRSDTLVSQVELMRFRFFCEEQQSWVKSTEVKNLNNTKGVQFAVLLVSDQPIRNNGIKKITLWDETLNPPKDGLYRQLISSTVRLTGANNEQP